MNLLNKKGLVIRHLPRHDEAVLRRCEAAGVATLHEAWDRQGLMGPAIRPIQQGVSRAGNAVTVLVTPGDNWMFHVAVEQCRAGDILVVAPTSPCGDGFFGDLLATSLQSRGVVGLFATTSIGIFMGTLARSMPQLGLLMILVLLPLQMLSGGSTPRESMPQLVQDIMLTMPTTHFVSLAQAILYRGASFAIVWPQFLNLLAIGGVFFTIALLRFRKTIGEMA